LKEEKAKELKWMKPKLEYLGTSKLSHGIVTVDCTPGSTPSAGAGACSLGSTALGCTGGNGNFVPCSTGNGVT